MKKLILLLALAIGASAQNTGQNIVNVLITSSTTITDGGSHTFTFPATGGLHNIGQTSHEIRIVDIANFAGQFWGVSGAMQGSLDGTVWFDIGPRNDSFVTTAAGSVRVTGINPYPYLRTNVTVKPTGANVTVKIVYIGNSAPVINTPISTSPLIVFDDDLQYGEVQSYTFMAGEKRGYVGQSCMNLGSNPMLYGLAVSNVGAVDTQIFIHQFGVTSTTDVVIFDLFVPAKATVIIPQTQRAFMVGGGAGFTSTEQMQVKISSSAAATISSYITFRCEPKL